MDVLGSENVNCRRHFVYSIFRICTVSYAFKVFCIPNMYTVVRIVENHSVRIDNSTFERVEEFKYLGTTLTIQNSIWEEIKNRLRSGNACYHSVQNLLSSRLLSR